MRDSFMSLFAILLFDLSEEDFLPKLRVCELLSANVT